MRTSVRGITVAVTANAFAQTQIRRAAEHVVAVRLTETGGLTTERRAVKVCDYWSAVHGGIG